MSRGRPIILLITLEGSDLEHRCREALASLGMEDFELLKSQTYCPQIGAQAHICLWDYSPTLDLPVNRINERRERHLFLVRAEHVSALLDLLPDVRALLLHPPTRSTLSAFLQAFLNQIEEVPQDESRSERDWMLECLLSANLKLQEQDQGRSNFMARTAHSLRAPLTAVNGYCGLLLDGLMGPLNPNQREVLEKCRYSIKRLSRMADGMLDLGLGPHVERRMDLVEADLDECVTRALQQLEPLMREKRISCTVNLDPVPGALLLEPSRIEDLLVNLLENACKFTPRFGSIEIRGYSHFWERRSMPASREFDSDRRVSHAICTNSYRVDLLDSGPGVAPPHVEEVFEEFVSYSPGTARSTGLGLAICRAILRAHNGRIWAEASERGGKFSFVLPLSAGGRGTSGQLSERRPRPRRASA